MSEDVAVTISRDPAFFKESSSFFLKPDEMNLTSNMREYLKFHCFTRRSNYTAMNFEMKPHNPGIHFNVSEICCTVCYISSFRRPGQGILHDQCKN